MWTRHLGTASCMDMKSLDGLLNSVGKALGGERLTWKGTHPGMELREGPRASGVARSCMRPPR